MIYVVGDKAYWTRTHAEQHGKPQEVRLSTIAEALDEYYAYRQMRMPGTVDAMLFLASETGELADAIVSGRGDWVRNNPDKVKDIPGEVGDVLQMLAVTANTFGIDPIAAMFNKWQSKGFDRHGKGKE